MDFLIKFFFLFFIIKIGSFFIIINFSYFVCIFAWLFMFHLLYNNVHLFQAIHVTLKWQVVRRCTSSLGGGGGMWYPNIAVSIFLGNQQKSSYFGLAYNDFCSCTFSITSKCI